MFLVRFDLMHVSITLPKYSYYSCFMPYALFNMMWLLLHRGYYYMLHHDCYYTVAIIRMGIITVAIIISWLLCCGHYYCGYYSCGYYGMEGLQ